MEHKISPSSSDAASKKTCQPPHTPHPLYSLPKKDARSRRLFLMYPLPYPLEHDRCVLYIPEDPLTILHETSYSTTRAGRSETVEDCIFSWGYRILIISMLRQTLPHPREELIDRGHAIDGAAERRERILVYIGHVSTLLYETPEPIVRRRHTVVHKAHERLTRRSILRHMLRLRYERSDDSDDITPREACPHDRGVLYGEYPEHSATRE